ncbi:MAG TPA: HAD family hydrolase [Nitrososphaeraceae archaeon]|nr:HAD family hydrolase [Nitrososphaeraceae archaeon]
MKRPFIFFDLGQTLINEWSFIDYFDMRFFEMLNGFGARINFRNYQTIRDNVIRNRKIGHGSVRELIIEVCKLICQQGYGKIILQRLEPELKEAKRNFFCLFDDAEQTMNSLLIQYDLGIIANQSEDILKILEESKINRFFKVIVISSEVKVRKPDPEIFRLAMNLANTSPEHCIMVGDRLDTDIGPANKLGMKTIRTTNSLFKLQQPMNEFEKPTYVVANLSEIANILDKLPPDL